LQDETRSALALSQGPNTAAQRAALARKISRMRAIVKSEPVTPALAALSEAVDRLAALGSNAPHDQLHEQLTLLSQRLAQDHALSRFVTPTGAVIAAIAPKSRAAAVEMKPDLHIDLAGTGRPRFYGGTISHQVDAVATLGSLVKARRRAMNLNQQEFADLAGVGRRFVSELEAGKPSLEIGKVLGVCRAAGIDILAAQR